MSIIDKRTWLTAKSVFVLSTGRVGTRTLFYLMKPSRRINAYHEPRPPLTKERKTARTEVYNHLEMFQRIFVDARRRRVIRSWLTGKIYVETSARLTFFAPAIANVMPNSRFIYLHRHPAEVIRSGMRRRWYNNHPEDEHRIEPCAHEQEYEKWKTWSAFEKVCWYWDAYNRFILDFIENTPSGRVFELKAEDLFSNNFKAIEALCDFIGIPAIDRSIASSVLCQRYNEQKENEFPEFSTWTTEYRNILKGIAGETSEKLGYLI